MQDDKSHRFRVKIKCRALQSVLNGGKKINSYLFFMVEKINKLFILTVWVNRIRGNGYVISGSSHRST